MGSNVFIRPPFETDASKLLEWENNPVNWEFSETTSPFELDDMIRLIEELQDVRKCNQVRSIICLESNHEPIGTVDLFEIDWKNRTAGMGVLIADEENRQRGFASKAIGQIIPYATELWGIQKFTCTIQHSNKKSIGLFMKMGFRKVENKSTEEMLYFEKNI